MRKFLYSLALLVVLSPAAWSLDGWFSDGGSGGGSSGGGGSGTVSAGSAGAVGVYSGGTTIGPSTILSDNGSTVTVSGAFVVGGGASIITSTNSTIVINVATNTPVVTFSTFSSVPDCLQVYSDSSTTALSLTAIPELIYSMSANSTYYVQATVIYQTAATTTGLSLAWDVPSDSTPTATVGIPIVADAAAAMWWGQITSDLDTVTSPTTPAVSLFYAAEMYGVVTTLTAGNLTLDFASEANGSTAKIKAGSRICLSKQR